MTIKIGSIVTIDTLGTDYHVVIGQATKGWWLQNLVTGALPTRTHRTKARINYWQHAYVDIDSGFMPSDMREAKLPITFALTYN